MKGHLCVVIVSLFCVLTGLGQTVAFVGVNVIPMDRERVLANQTVVVRDGRIADIGDARKIKVPTDAVRVDGRGKYLMPGLVDMHTHLMSDSDMPDAIAEDELRVMVAQGVTTIRLMIGTPEQLVLRERSARGEIVAPTIYSASPHLTGREQGNNFVVATPDEAREAVRKSKQAGYDFIKITTFIKPEVYEAAVGEAAKIGIRVVGHADSRFVGVERAWKAKQQIEHLDGYIEMLLADNAPMKGSVSDLYIYNPDNWKSLDFIDEAKIAVVARRTVEANPFVDPTQHFMKNTFGRARSEESIRAQPDFRFYPEEVQNRFLDFYKRTRLNQVPLEKRARWIELREKMIKAIYDAGGKLLAGSDTPEFLWLYGFAMHHELQALKDAGVPNYGVLAAATRNAHEFFGTIDRGGTVEKGKQADLLLLNANPLADLSATTRRTGVMLKGKWYEQTEMDKWLDEIAVRFHATAPVHDDPAAAQHAAAAEVPQKLFAAMKAKDVAAMKALFMPGGQVTALDKPKEGNAAPFARNFTTDSFAAMIASGKGEYIEKMANPDVRLYGDAAVINGAYTFHVGEKFSHCGTNAFHLLRSDGVWKIANITSTLEFTGCDAARPGGDAKPALDAVKGLFELMSAYKPDAIVAAHTPESQLAALIRGRDGKATFENLTRDAFSKFFAEKRADITEHMYAPRVSVFGDMAVVDGRYVFFANHKAAHCGMNSFHVVRTADGWKLGNSISTIEPAGCTEAEKAMTEPASASQ